MSVQQSDLNDPALVTEVDLARAAAQEEAGDERVGEYVSYHVEDEAAVTHLFEADKAGYRGWRWAVTITSAGPSSDITVSEVVLLPGPSALVAPDWVPWQYRVQAGDLGVGDLLPTAPDDPRLVPAYLASDDPAVEEVAVEVGLGRARVMSRPARLEAATRWQESEYGPRSDMARSAPAHCGTCGFYLPLAGSLRAVFGTCGNEISPADGHVVHAEYGCGAHSEAEVEQVSPVLVADLIYDDAQLEVEPLAVVDEIPAPTEEAQALEQPAEPVADDSAVDVESEPELSVEPVMDDSAVEPESSVEPVADDSAVELEPSVESAVDDQQPALLEEPAVGGQAAAVEPAPESVAGDQAIAAVDPTAVVVESVAALEAAPERSVEPTPELSVEPAVDDRAAVPSEEPAAGGQAAAVEPAPESVVGDQATAAVDPTAVVVESVAALEAAPELSVEPTSVEPVDDQQPAPSEEQAADDQAVAVEPAAEVPAEDQATVAVDPTATVVESVAVLEGASAPSAESTGAISSTEIPREASLGMSPEPVVEALSSPESAETISPPATRQSREKPLPDVQAVGPSTPSPLHPRPDLPTGLGPRRLPRLSIQVPRALIRRKAFGPTEDE
jgi:hypothetical protein